jgi:hypothetical protein
VWARQKNKIAPLFSFRYQPFAAEQVAAILTLALASLAASASAAIALCR